MTKSDGRLPGGLSRRTALKGAASAAALLAAPAFLTGRARAQATIGGDIDWKQAAGTKITVGVIPAGYFQNLEALLPQFRELSGVDVTLEATPPGQIRQKAILDLSSKTGTWATSATDPMYYPLYASNGWIDPLTDFLDNPDLTDKAWFDYDDILEKWRGSTSFDGVPYGIPFDGEATIQIYRSDVYEKLGLKAAETLDDYAANAQKVNDPANRLWGAALRGFKVDEVARGGHARHQHQPRVVRVVHQPQFAESQRGQRVRVRGQLRVQFVAGGWRMAAHGDGLIPATWRRNPAFGATPARRCRRGSGSGRCRG